MNLSLSLDTIAICREVLAQVSLTSAVPDAVAKMTRLVAADQELLAAQEQLLAAAA